MQGQIRSENIWAKFFHKNPLLSGSRLVTLPPRNDPWKDRYKLIHSFLLVCPHSFISLLSIIYISYAHAKWPSRFSITHLVATTAISVCVHIVRRMVSLLTIILSSQHLGVFELYQDPALTQALEVVLGLAFSIPRNELMVGDPQLFFCASFFFSISSFSHYSRTRNSPSPSLTLLTVSPKAIFLWPLSAMIRFVPPPPSPSSSDYPDSSLHPASCPRWPQECGRLDLIPLLYGSRAYLCSEIQCPKEEQHCVDWT